MKPKKPDNHPDLFRSQLSQIINLSHPLYRLSDKINWQRLESNIEEIYGHGCGQPPLPTRLLAGLHYLKYTFNESDESVVDRWVENPYWQYFCGFEQLQHQCPLHPTSLTRWRNRVGDKLEALLEEILTVALETKALKPHALKHVNVDTTVHEKAVAFPTDARLYHKMRVTLVREAHKRNIPLRQSFKKVGKKAFIMQGRYASAKQMKRAAKQTRKLKTYLGRLTRDIQRKATSIDEPLATLLERSQRLLKQQRNDKNKLYSIHEPDVRCIAKGKIHKRYEFGSKASFTTTSKDNWVVSAQSLDNPYDGHTLASALKQVTQLTGITPQNAYCDMGYRGHGLKGDTKIHLVGKIPKRATKSLRKWMKRRAAVEPIIGHLKSDYRLNRNHLKGQAGDRANAVLAAAAYNMSKLLAWFYCAAFLRQKIEAFIGKLGINLSHERELIA
jgi:IS5 family transposase